jgi:hypothetical protein
VPPGERVEASSAVAEQAGKLKPTALLEVLPKLPTAMGELKSQHADAARDEVLTLTPKIVNDAERRSLALHPRVR